MARYTKEQLKSMAERCLEARKAGDSRYLELCLTLQYFTGLAFKEVESNIQKLAEVGKV